MTEFKVPSLIFPASYSAQVWLKNRLAGISTPLVFGQFVSKHFNMSSLTARYEESPPVPQKQAMLAYEPHTFA